MGCGDAAAVVRAPPRSRAGTRLVASGAAGDAGWSGRWSRDRCLFDRRRTAGPAARPVAERLLRRCAAGRTRRCGAICATPACATATPPRPTRRRCSSTSCWTTRPVTFRCRSRSRPTAILSWHRATAAAVCRVAGRRSDRGRVEVLSFHTIACEETVRHGMPARLVAWADYAPAALARLGGACRRRRRLHRALPPAPCPGRAPAARWSRASRPGRSTTRRWPREPLSSASTRSPPIDRRRCTTSLPRRRRQPERRPQGGIAGRGQPRRS